MNWYKRTNLEFPWRRLTIYKCMQCQILASLCSFHILCPSCILTNEPLIILPWAAQVFLLGLGFLFVFIPFHISRVAINIQAEVWIGEPSQDHKVPLPSIWSMLCTWVSNICSSVYKLKRKTSKIPTTLILLVLNQRRLLYDESEGVINKQPAVLCCRQ